MTKTIKARLNNLENHHPNQPYITLYSDWDNPELWHAGGPQKGAALPWHEITAKYPGCQFIRVVYTRQWRPA